MLYVQKKKKQSHYPRTFTYDFEPQTSAENIFLRKGLLTRSSDIRNKMFEISSRLTWLNLPWKKQFPTIYLYGLFDIKGIKIVLEYCHLKWL